MKRPGIRAKVAFVAVAVLVAALGLSTAVSQWFFAEEYGKVQWDKTRAVAKTLHLQLDRLLKLGIDLHDITGFEEQCTDIVKGRQDVAYAMVFDVNGKVLFQDQNIRTSSVAIDQGARAAITKHGETERLYRGRDGGYMEVIIPVLSTTGEHVGAIRVGTPQSVVSERVARVVVSSVVVSLLAIILSILTIYLAVSRWVTGPITDLLGLIRNRTGEQQPPGGTAPWDEMTELSDSFRMMMDDLERSTVSREYFNGIISSMMDSLMIVRRDGRVKMANSAALGLLGYSEEEIVGTPARLILPSTYEEHCPECAPPFRESVQAVCRTREGALVPILFSCTPLSGKGGDGDAVCTWTDITALKKSEEEREKLRDQLIRSQKMESIGILAGGIAHDFNNLLTAVIGYANLLEMKLGKDHPHTNYVTQILKSADVAAELTRGLLAYSSKQVLIPKPNDLNELVIGIQKMLDRIIGEDIEFSSILCSSPLVALVDRAQMEQVLMNLVTNARDAMPEGGSLIIETGIRRADEIGDEKNEKLVAKEYAVISVSDTGSGMDESTQRRIFEPFFTTKEMRRGTGLGLSIVYGIVRQHDGFVHVFSEPGRGTTFRVHLPLVPPELKEPEKPDCQVSPGRGSGTILVTEDDERVRDLVREVLEDAGYTVLAAVNGADAVEVFAAGRDSIDLVLMDVIMPVKGGIEAMQEIRKIDPKVPVLFMSGYNEQMINRKGVVSDEVNLLQKPIVPRTLLIRVRELLDSSPRGASPHSADGAG
jgi:PAS domain S-box-containing protein